MLDCKSRYQDNFLALVAAMCLKIRNCNLILFFFQTGKCFLAKETDICVNKCLVQSNIENNNTDTDYLGYMILLKNDEGTTGKDVIESWLINLRLSYISLNTTKT